MEGFNLGFEFGLLSLYVMITFMWLYFYLAKKKGPEYTYFRWGLVAKILGGIAFGAIYMFYYQYGDTFMYFESAKILGEIIAEDPIYGMQLVFEVSDYVRAEDYLYNHFLVNYFRGDDTFTVIKIAGVFSILGMGGFYSTTVLFSCFAFWGQWKLYQTFIRRYPTLKFELAIAHFFIPSVIFWGSGVMKDSLIMGFLGAMIHYLDKVLFQKQMSVKNVLIIAIAGYLIYVIKAYVLLAFLPAFAFWLFYSVNQRIKNPVIKFVVLPVILVGIFVSSLYSYTLLEAFDERFKTENLFNQASVYQKNHYSEHEVEGTRSGYTLGEYDQTIGGVLTQFFPAINVALFRPYLWEIKSPIMALSGLESLGISLFTLFVLLKIRLNRIFNYLVSDSFLIMCFVYSIAFAFIVGFSSYNFGALSRYKIPCLPFFVSFLILITKRYVNAEGMQYLKKDVRAPSSYREDLQGQRI